MKGREGLSSFIMLYLCVPLEFSTIFFFLSWEFLKASCPGYMPLLVQLTSHPTQDASGLGGRIRNPFSRMLSNEGNKTTTGGC